MPSYQKTEKRPLSTLEKSALKDCIDKKIFTPRETAFIIIIYSTGLRRCEALALTAFDFKFSSDENYVTVTKDLIFDGNTPEIRPMPKTSNGIRKVPLPSYAVDYLQQYINGLNSTGLFSCKTRLLITKSSYDKMWCSIITKLNTAAGGTRAFPIINGLTAHIFRHNYCSNLCYKVPEISIKKIAQLMGDTEKVVLDTYNHIIDEKEDVSKVVESALAM